MFGAAQPAAHRLHTGSGEFITNAQVTLATCVVAFALLALQRRGVRRFETVLAGLLGIILLGFRYDALHAGVDPGALATGMVPSLSGTDGGCPRAARSQTRSGAARAASCGPGHRPRGVGRR